jgi:HK97 family phage major capsid protein
MLSSNPVLSSLRSAHEEKRTAAQEAWQAFAKKRDALTESGVDLSTDTKALTALDDLHSAYKAVADEAQDLEARMLKAIDGKAAPIPGETARDGMASIGAAFLKGMGVGGVGLKALDGTSGGTLVPPFFDDRLRDLPQRSLFVRSLIPVRQADSDKVWYLRTTMADHQATVVPAGEEKPTSTYTIERIEVPIVTIAHVTEPLDRALLMDYDALTDFIDLQLRYGVLMAEEDQVLNGSGSPPELEGILTAAGQTQPRGSDPQLECIYKGMTKLRNAFFEPDGIVLNPNDWESIRLSKDATGNYLSGSVISGDNTRLWGTPVVTSKAIAQGTGLVGQFSVGASLWSREEARVTFTESGMVTADGSTTELFVTNRVLFRGEERMALAIERPDAFCMLTSL